MARPGRYQSVKARNGFCTLVQRLAACAGVDSFGGAAGRGLESAEQPSGRFAQDPRGPGQEKDEWSMEAVEDPADHLANASVHVECEHCDFCRRLQYLCVGIH